MYTASSVPAGGGELVPARLSAVSVYVHIPFCASRCNYCDFYFETTRSPRVIGAILDGIIEEASACFDAAGAPRVTSLYFGGGTPSVIPPPLLDGFLSELDGILFPDRRGWRPGGEVERTFEANPESVSPELLDVLHGHGINRLSLGVQTFNDELLRALTRRADSRQIASALEAIDRFHRVGSRLRVNVDLITGIPGQTEETVGSDIETALAHRVDHFSLYSLTVEEHTPLRQAVDRGIRRMPSPEQQDALWLSAKRAIEAEGFEWYEISNFARTGCRSAHNLAYWRLFPYVGLGPGAVSTLPMVARDAPDESPIVARVTNPNLFIYGSKSKRDGRGAVERLDPSSFLFEHFITGLRTSEGVSLPYLQQVFGIDLLSVWGDRLERWVAEGVAEEAQLGGAQTVRLVLTRTARLALDRHLLELGSWIDELGASGVLPAPKWPPARPVTTPEPTRATKGPGDSA